MDNRSSADDRFVELLLRSTDELAELERKGVALGMRIAAIRKLLSGAMNRLLAPRKGKRNRRRGLSPHALQAMKRIVRPVDRVTIEYVLDGSANVVIEDGGRTEFTRPRKLTALLAAICSGEPGDDGLPSFRSRETLLVKLLGISRPALNQLVYLLRKELFEERHLNPWLVETSPQGIRFLARTVLVK